MENKHHIFKRKLLTERIFIGRPANYAIMTARINGSFSINQFRIVLSKLRRKHPLLGTRILFDENDYAWLTNENVPELSVIEMQRTKDDQWIEIVANEHRHVFDLRKGPLIRFILLKDSHTLDLIINCHHSICDGLSLAYLIRDILYYLANATEEIKQISSIPPFNKQNIPGRGKRNILTTLLIKTINKFWKRNKIRFSQRDYEKLSKTFWTKNSSEIIAWQLTKSQTSTFINVCRKEGVTVNTALITAFLAAQSKILEKSRSNGDRVHIPINIRNRLKVPAGEAFGFYAQTLILNLHSDQNKSFWELARNFNKVIHTEIQNEKSTFNLFKVAKIDPTLLDSTYYYKYGISDNKWSARLLKGMGSNDVVADLSITNIGNLNFPTDFNGLSIEALYGPSVYSDILNFIVGVATLGGKMNIIITFDEQIISMDNVLKVKQFFISTLEKLCNW